MNSDDDKTRTHVVLTKGTMVSHYRIVEKIGAGGMGEVYLAEDTKLKRRVALKFLTVAVGENIHPQKMLLREAQAAAGLQHPNVVTIYEVGVSEERPFLAMAYVEGSTLNELKKKLRVSIEMAVRFGIQISNGLTGAHEHGITHRDLKPNNLMVDKSHNLHILDFGLAVEQSSTSGDEIDKTVTNHPLLDKVAGTLNYMAPEQLAGGEIGPLVDIFALGIILFELIYDYRPFEGSSQTELLRNLLSDSPLQFPDNREDVPYDLVRIIGRCLQKDPEYRFQTAKDVRNELLALQELMSTGSDSTDLFFVASKKLSFLKEERFILTTDYVRKLGFQSPKMIGDHITYLDNGVLSDTLVIYLHAWGLDHRQSTDFLKDLPYRGIAPSLYGFGQHAKHRFPLSLNDHSHLLRMFFGVLKERINPQRVILTGFSSGADHCMHIASSDIYPGLDIAGVLVFGCNTGMKSCFLSAKFAELQNSNADGIFDELKQIGSSSRSLGEWLKFHEYMVTVFSKFGTNVDPLRTLGADIVKPFKERDWKQFVYWHQTVTKKYHHARFIIDLDDFDAMDRIMGHHLKENVLGDDFQDNTIVRENVSHVELANAEILLRHTLEFIQHM